MKNKAMGMMCIRAVLNQLEDAGLNTCNLLSIWDVKNCIIFGKISKNNYYIASL
ncbi:hypothetical protein BTN50_0288 [Candidatus Enterovibrio altilux]|uniref:Uncharacterized protein n=1 Tax=Candidatus Enterovibrio altilux TaxID=1927128 RepID=A0A291B756_9GAMM|nr:hypothetical protein BTN50_0288 [Candidatus Enterovibrio luxaltus]